MPGKRYDEVPAAVATAALFASTLAATSASAGFVDKNCSDFANQAEAQQFYEANGGPAVDGLGKRRGLLACGQ